LKREILEVLKRNKNTFISGEDLSNELGVTRAAIWKYIKGLKSEGYQIESIPRKGYCLIDEPDILSLEELQIELQGRKIGNKIYYFKTIDSTNNYAKKIGLDDFIDGTIIISEEQTNGRGRLGRNWVSPSGKGLWLSLLLKPNIEPSEAAKITAIGAVAVAVAIEKTTGVSAGIKWPNDIIMDRKKVCGILTEMSAELNHINYVVVGIGVNVNNNDFPKEIKDIATSVKLSSEREVSRKDLLFNILETFEELYYDFINKGNLNKTIKICREKSVTLGRNIRVIGKDEIIYGKALDINDDAELIVRKDNGEIITIISGEVSVRGISDYI